MHLLVVSVESITAITFKYQLGQLRIFSQMNIQSSECSILKNNGLTNKKRDKNLLITFIYKMDFNFFPRKEKKSVHNERQFVNPTGFQEQYQKL